MMTAKIEFVPAGGVTSPRDFSAGAIRAGIKGEPGEKPDLGILFSGVPAAAAGVFTRNRIQAPSVILSRQRLGAGRATAVVANSGCANACVGAQGRKDAEEMTALAAKALGVPEEEVVVGSTGVIGIALPMAKIREGMGRIVLGEEGGHDFARAIMTTDTVPKEVAVDVGGEYIIGGVAKGSGMIYPDLATMLCFLTTDAAVAPEFLATALRQAVDISFNMIAVDTDTSPNDSVIIMANGRSGGEAIAPGSPRAEVFREALNRVCVHLARGIVRDGEGATKLLEVVVRGAPSVPEARAVARGIVASPLVKTAVHGSDPNWGRILVAAGRSGVAFEEDRLELSIGGIPVFRQGRPVSFKAAEVVKVLDGAETRVELDLNAGDATATAWGCDLSEEYVAINSEYTT
ncbi:MAG: bifunctional glutamate N-acetyltransferase/amino-acid acetyltransferase ArgJ [Chloroflexota bacterium]